MSYISTSGNCTYYALHFMCQRTTICCMSTDLSDRHVSTALSSICQHNTAWNALAPFNTAYVSTAFQLCMSGLHCTENALFKLRLQTSVVCWKSCFALVLQVQDDWSNPSWELLLQDWHQGVVVGACPNRRIVPIKVLARDFSEGKMKHQTTQVAWR